jgi:hypothetical protein
MARLILAGVLFVAATFGAVAATPSGGSHQATADSASGGNGPAPLIVATGPCNPRVRVCE